MKKPVWIPNVGWMVDNSPNESDCSKCEWKYFIAPGELTDDWCYMFPDRVDRCAQYKEEK